MKAASGPVNSVRGFLERIPLFSNLNPDSLTALARYGKFISAEKGQFIFVQSDLSENFYIVYSGLVSIVLESIDGREMVINEIRPEEFFGELGLVTRQGRSASAVARIDSKLLVFPRQAFMGILDAEPLLARRLLEITANRLRGSSEREGALAFMNAQARLARLLLQLDKEEVEKGYVTISQGELAQRTGLTRQTVAKALGRWRRQGWLITGRGRILLLKHGDLARLAAELKNR